MMEEEQWGNDELNFEYIDWNDITDAEFSGDQDAIERLMNQSQEIRRHHSMSETPKSSEPTTPCLTVSTPNDLPFADFCSNKEDRDPNIINSAPPKSRSCISTPFSSRNPLGQSKRTKSYAHITRSGAGKVGKRRTNERVGLSPIDLPRRKNFRELLSPPPVFPPTGQLTTPDPLPITSELKEINLDEVVVDTSTPESDRLARGIGVQRRLFGGQMPSPEQVQDTAISKGAIQFGCPPPWFPKPNEDKLCDIHRLAQRQRQIDMGKETVGYERYTQTIPKWKRGRAHPWTPDKYTNCSTRAWQGQIKQWRRNLHKFDPPPLSTCSVSSQEQQFTAEDAALCELNMDESPLEL